MLIANLGNISLGYSGNVKSMNTKLCGNVKKCFLNSAKTLFCKEDRSKDAVIVVALSFRKRILHLDGEENTVS
jgi:hypothetical protein